jgi:DNA polymerase (family 10)
LDNLAIARVLGEIADLLEIKAGNPFKIRAYRSAADAVAHAPDRVEALDAAALRTLPGIGKEIAAKIRELVETGRMQHHQELLAEFPLTLLELLRLQGVGPKTAALLYQALHISTLEELEGAARSGRLRTLRGMGAKKEELILKALDERRQYGGRHLLARMRDLAATLIAHLQPLAPGAELVPVGSLRRGAETCGDLDILAIGGPRALIRAFTGNPLAERVLGEGDTKGSVLLRGGYQADLRLVPHESRGAALQYFTGSKAHNIALRDRAIARGAKLNEYGLFDVATGLAVAGETEEGIYEALGLAWIPPELRENRGEIEAAGSATLPRLIARADLRGDLHCHTTATDGRDTIEAMAAAARAGGLSYLAIADHTQSLTMVGGLDEAAVLEHAARIRAVNARMDGIEVLAGIECDIRPDGTLDLDDECLRQLDLVVASVHSAFDLDAARMTARVLRAIASPHVDVLAHPTGRLLLRRAPYALDLETVIDAAAREGVALEINSLADRLDLGDVNARLARSRGAPLVIDSDAHGQAGFAALADGVTVARRAWLEAGDVLNALPFDRFRKRLRRNRG